MIASTPSGPYHAPSGVTLLYSIALIHAGISSRSFLTLNRERVPSGLTLISALSVGSQVSGISPASTGGALVLAAYVTLYKPNSDQKNRYFLRLFITSIIGVLFMSALGFIGLYSWFI